MSDNWTEDPSIERARAAVDASPESDDGRWLVEMFLARRSEGASLLRVVFEGELADGTPYSEEYKKTGEELPQELPARVHFPQKTLDDFTKPRKMVAHAYFQLFADGEVEAVTLTLWENGKRGPASSASNVG